MGQNLVPLVNINIAGKWMFIPLKMVLLGIEYGIDPWTYQSIHHFFTIQNSVCFSWLLVGLHLVDGFGGNDDSRKDLHGCRCAMAYADPLPRASKILNIVGPGK